MDVGKKLCDHDVVGRLQWEPRTAQPESDPFTDAMRYWVNGMQKGYPPTWTTLFKVLRELDLQELSKQVEEFLTRMFGLNSSWLHVGLGIPQHNKITNMRVHGGQSSGFRVHHLTTARAVGSPLKEHLIIILSGMNKQAPIER